MTRSGLCEGFVEHSDVAGTSTGAVAIKDVNHVDRTADVAKVLTDALVDAHSTVARMRNDDHLVPRTLCPEVIGVTNRHIPRFICTHARHPASQQPRLATDSPAPQLQG